MRWKYHEAKNFMMKQLFFISIIFILISCNASIKTFQTKDEDKIGVKSSRFRGTAFKSSYPKEKLYETPDSLNRFTPTTGEIRLAETILNARLPKENNTNFNGANGGKNIDRNLNKYFRQYVGFISSNGDTIIHINLYWDKYSIFDRMRTYNSNSDKYTHDFEMILDGGYRYWNINVNLTRHVLERPVVNGIA
jgi:hypothetical protein